MSRKSLSEKNHDETHAAEHLNKVEYAVGVQIRKFRKQLDLTVVEVSRKASLSAGMLSKIERGVTSPSLGTLQSLATALNVPITSFFRGFELRRNCTFIKSEHGLPIERHGTRSGRRYSLLGHNMGDELIVEPYLITLSDDSDTFPLFEHPGVEFIYLLEGEMIYRHMESSYHMCIGDSLFFDSDTPHGPAKLITLPIRMIAVLAHARGN